MTDILPRLPVGSYFEQLVHFLELALAPFFSSVKTCLEWFIANLEWMLDAPERITGVPSYWFLAVVSSLLAWRLAGRNMSVISFLGILLIASMGLWAAAVRTLALVITATIIALGIGIPTGILAAKFRLVNTLLRPILDFMQTLPAFVYLLPAVIFFRVGPVSAVISTIIFAMPPAVRLTNLGIRQVPTELIEAGEAFGSSGLQLLLKIQLPQALPTIMAGINQCIMLALSMVVIASMVGGGGLGSVVITGVQGFKIGLGFEGGIAVVIIAIILDRLTQGKN